MRPSVSIREDTPKSLGRHRPVNAERKPEQMETALLKYNQDTGAYRETSRRCSAPPQNKGCCAARPCQGAAAAPRRRPAAFGRVYRQAFVSGMHYEPPAAAGDHCGGAAVVYPKEAGKSCIAFKVIKHNPDTVIFRRPSGGYFFRVPGQTPLRGTKGFPSISGRFHTCVGCTMPEALPPGQGRAFQIAVLH